MRSISCILLFVVVAMASDNRPQYNLNDAPALFEKFIKDYNRTYKDEADKAVHFEAFKKSLNKINEANAKQSTATFDINKFADYTPEESKHLFGFRTMSMEPQPTEDILHPNTRLSVASLAFNTMTDNNTK
ncbi:unnamed protein product [Euphydryas editha]|uniref:Cathepsin propeptide inhibitor domain-containing protein n=1 Tax=Euphydryas editha TaxID=104508 RepID=A0AAU9V472_EUPED|nr:unnamed protein product [Euphydryas editha]